MNGEDNKDNDKGKNGNKSDDIMPNMLPTMIIITRPTNTAMTDPKARSATRSSSELRSLGA